MDFPKNELKLELFPKGLNFSISEIVALIGKQEISKASKRVELLRDVAHDQLNVGKYCDVDIKWRRAYYLCSFIQAFCQVCEKHASEVILKVCDEGLLMGAPVSGFSIHDIIGRTRPRYTSSVDKPSINCSIEQTALPILRNSIQRISRLPTLEEWINIREAGKPILIAQGASLMNWPALEKWSFEYLWEKFKGRTVPIEEGGKYTDENWGQRLRKFDDFLDSFNDKNIKSYLAQKRHPLLEQAPELYDDIDFPDYCFTESSDDPEVNAWIGPAGTVSSLHTDNKFNLFSQIRGKKYFVFADQKFSSLIPAVNKVMFNSSKLEVEDQEVWTNSGIIFEDCIVEEGDLLYIPKLYWHYVRSLSPSISLSIWFQ